MITDERLEKAINFIAQTDEEAAELTANARRLELKAKAIWSACFLHAEAKTVAEREALATTHQEYAIATDAQLIAQQLADTMKNRRGTAVLIHEAWRSFNANRRQG